MKNFSHSWDSTYWATEYPCSSSVVSLERALVRTEQKQDLFWLLWWLWLSLNAVLQTPAFFLTGSDVGYFCFLCRFSGSVWALSIYKLISVFCSMKYHNVLRPSSQVPGTSFLTFSICQHLSFMTWCFARVVTSFCTFYLSWQFPWFIFLSFLCFRHDTWGGREITYCLQALITHSAELFFETDHVYPTIWLKTFSLSWGDGCICWCYLEHLGKWRELSAPPGGFWHTLRNLAQPRAMSRDAWDCIAWEWIELS